MSLEEGQAFNDKLMPIMRGVVQPSRELPPITSLYTILALAQSPDPLKRRRRSP